MADREQDKLHSPENLRDEAEGLLAQAHAQMADIQRALDAVVGDDGLQSRLMEVAAQMSGAIGTLSQALKGPASALRRADLLALQSVVQSGQATALLTQVAVQSGSAGRMENLAAASAATRDETRTLAHDVFGRRIFAPYLRFESSEDEEAFRKREAEARKYIEAQLARGTPEGNINAGGGMLGHMLDAHAHGAGDSPEFMPRWNALAEKLQGQRAAMRAAGQSTEECDRNLAASVRLYLKETARLSDAEIDERLAGIANPLDVVKPFLKKSHASRKLEETAVVLTETARTKSEDLPHIETIEITAVMPTARPIDPETMRARLKAAGVLMDGPAEGASGHGLPAQRSAGAPGQGRPI